MNARDFSQSVRSELMSPALEIMRLTGRLETARVRLEQLRQKWDATPATFTGTERMLAANSYHRQLAHVLRLEAEVREISR